MNGFAVSGGDIIDVFAGGHLDNNTLQWLGQRNESVMQSVTSAAQGFFQQAQNLYQMVSSSDALMMMRNLKAKTENTWAFDIVPVTSLVGLQTANPYMQRWIMAQPELRQRYLNQEVEGYGESYENKHGDTVGDSHYDYRRVMDGVVTHTAEQFGYKHYLEQTPEGERELTVFEKVDILKTWNTVQKYLDEGDEDPSSVTGAML
jgi:hypothetical protein